MRNVNRIRSALGVGVLILLAACSSATSSANSGTPSGGGNSVAIRVTNDIVPPTSVTVWMVPETGSRRRLGTISPNGQQTFNFTPNLRSMDHRLMAEASGMQDAVSNPFVLEGVTSVQWDVSSALVRTR